MIGRVLDTLLIGGALAIGVAASFRQPPVVQPVVPPAAVVVQATPLSAPLPKACWPSAMLTGRDTAWLYVPCRSLDVLPIGFRKPVECTLDRMAAIGDTALVAETGRSAELQERYWQKGRNGNPGPRVTNVRDLRRGFHGFRLGTDVVSKRDGWKRPRFFNKLGHAAEACGLVAGVFWKRMTDGPHIQYAGWDGAPPLWAQQLLAFGADSLHVIHRRAGVLN